MPVSLADRIYGCAGASEAFRAGPATSPSGIRARQYRAALVLVAVFMLPAVALGAEKGWFGLAITVDAGGSPLNPIVHSITVQKVFASSPAASAGLSSGDAVVEVEGIVVAGARADLLKAAMQKSVGETLHLKIRRGEAGLSEVKMVAVSKPPGQ